MSIYSLANIKPIPVEGSKIIIEPTYTASFESENRVDKVIAKAIKFNPKSNIPPRSGLLSTAIPSWSLGAANITIAAKMNIEVMHEKNPYTNT